MIHLASQMTKYTCLRADFPCLWTFNLPGGGASAPASVAAAVCITGLVRTLDLPVVHWSMKLNLLDAFEEGGGTNVFWHLTLEERPGPRLRESSEGGEEWRWNMLGKWEAKGIVMPSKFWGWYWWDVRWWCEGNAWTCWKTCRATAGKLCVRCG